MKTRTDLLNHLAEKHDLENYLEVGLQRADQNFNKIICHYKISVDPDPKAEAHFQMTSDDYFEMFPETKFNLVFLDGLHSSEQLQRDFNNAMNILSDGGFICMHDTSPAEESLTHFPRDKSGPWNGSAYKFACKLNFFHYDPVTVDIDHGITIVRKKDLPPIEGSCTMPWETFELNRKQLLNLISWEEFVSL